MESKPQFKIQGIQVNLIKGFIPSWSVVSSQELLLPLLHAYIYILCSYRIKFQTVAENFMSLNSSSSIFRWRGLHHVTQLRWAHTKALQDQFTFQSYCGRRTLLDLSHTRWQVLLQVRELGWLSNLIFTHHTHQLDCDVCFYRPVPIMWARSMVVTIQATLHPID